MSGIPTGLDYPAVAVVAAAKNRRFKGQLLADLQVMEGAALKAWAKERDRP
jgi:hypothetical protein